MRAISALLLLPFLAIGLVAGIAFGALHVGWRIANDFLDWMGGE